ncbi:hypothetical protein ACP4OV_002216 [Aristida adscensionis]
MEKAALTAFARPGMALLLSTMEKKIKMWKGVRDESESLQRDLNMLASYMDDELTNSGGTPDSAVARESSEEMRDLMHDMENCIQRFLHRITCEQGAGWLPQAAHKVKTLRTRDKFGKEIMKLKKRLLQASERIKGLPVPGGGQSSSSSSAAAAAAAAGPARDPVERWPVGFVKAKEDLVALLDEVEGETTQKLRVISVAGFGGSGKTTLARSVYESPFADAQRFPCRAWVDRSDYNNASGLLSWIIKEFWPKEAESVAGEFNERRLQDHLRNNLRNQRFLIILDDMDMKHWDWIESAFEDNGTSSRIVVTTSMLPIANQCSNCGHGFVYQMRTLGAKDSEKIALSDQQGPHDPAFRALLEKCDGLPLALVSVANHFRRINGPRTGHCQELCNRLGSFLHEEPKSAHSRLQMDHFARLRGMLMDNYTSLPDYTVRTCFLYLGIFSDRRRLKRNKITSRWVAEGYARSSDPLGSEQKVADDNIKEFIDRNIIQPIGISSSGTCQAPGIVHEFVLHKAISENFIMPFDGPGHKRAFIWNKRHKKVRHLFVRDSDVTSPGTTLNIDFSSVWSLTVCGSAGSSFSEFSKYKVIRVLDLEECSDLNESHLEHIDKLWNLRYLSLGPNIKKLPKDITQLKLLERLHLSKNVVSELPLEVISMPCLIHLIGKFKLSDPEWEMESELEQLCRKSKLESIAGFVANGSQGFLQLMPYMKNLRKVKIWCDPTGNIININNHLLHAIKKYIEPRLDYGDVRSLSIDLQGLPQRSLHALDELNYHRMSEGKVYYLSSLKLYGSLSATPQFIPSLSDLTELCLSVTTLTQHLLSSLSGMYLLVHLKLIADHIEDLAMQIGEFLGLECLCFHIQGPDGALPQIQVQEGALPKLVSLQLLCKHLAGLSGIEIRHLLKLQEIELHPEVSEPARKEWEAAARNHGNRPNVLPFRSIDDPASDEPTVIPFAAPMELVPDGQSGPSKHMHLATGNTSELRGDMDDSAHQQPRVSSTVSPGEASPESDMPKQLQLERPLGYSQVQTGETVQSSPSNILNCTSSHFEAKSERGDFRDSGNRGPGENCTKRKPLQKASNRSPIPTRNLHNYTDTHRFLSFFKKPKQNKTKQG